MENIYKVLDLQSPFRWRPVIRKENLYEFDLEYEGEGFSFRNFCVRIVDFYDHYISGNLTAANELLNVSEDKLTALSNCDDEFFVKCKDALHHVLYACKALMAIHSGKKDSDVSQWIDKIKLFDEMDTSNKAALLAVKACSLSMYSNDSLESSLSQINMALSHDRTTPYWLFLKGMFLQKQRPSGEVPSILEKEMLEAAYKKDSQNPLFMVHFADTLRETCKYASKRPQSYLWFVAKSVQVNAEQEINKKYETASDLYRKSYDSKPKCPVIAFKCANGLMRLPPKFQDIKLIKKIVSNCENKFPNSGFGNLVLALYHERINKNIDKSRRCLDKCVELNVFHGCMNSVRLNYKEYQNTNTVESLEKMLDVFGEAVKQEIIISQIISYYVFVSSSIEKACEYMLKYYKKGNDGRNLEMHESCFVSNEGPVSLVNVITDKVKLELTDRKIPKEKRYFFNDFVRQMSFHNVEVLKGNPKNLLEEIQKSKVPKKSNPNKERLNDDRRNLSPRKKRWQSGDRAPNTSRSVDAVSKRGKSERRPQNLDAAARSDRQGYENDPINENAVRKRSDHRSEERNVNRRPGNHPDADFNSRKEHVDRKQHHSEERYADRRAAAPDQRARNEPKFEKKIPPPSASSQQPVEPTTKSAKQEDGYQELIKLCRAEGLKENIDEIFEKWKKLSLKGDADSKNESDRKVGHTSPEERRFDRKENGYPNNELRDVPANEDNMAPASAYRNRRRPETEESTKSHRRRDEGSVSASSSERLRERERRRRKHKKKHRRSSSSDGEADSGGSGGGGGRRRRSPSPRPASSRHGGHHRRRSRDERSRKSHRKRRSFDSAADSDYSAAERKREKDERSRRSQKKRRSSSERRREKRQSHGEDGRSSRRHKKESKKRYSESESDY